MEYMKRSLHKLSIDIRVSYAISNIQLEQEVHVEHRFDDCLNLVKLLGARWDKYYFASVVIKGLILLYYKPF